MSAPMASCSTRASTCSTGGSRPGDGDRLAITGTGGRADLRRSCTTGCCGPRPGCARSGLQPEQRVLMFMADSPEFVVVYLAAMRIGAVPVPVSTMLHADGLAELLRDSRARLLAVTREFADGGARPRPRRPELPGSWPRRAGPRRALPVHRLRRAGRRWPPTTPVYPTTADSPAFWLYTSGTTGTPKARDAPARLDPGRLRDLRRAGARHHARRPLPVRGQGVLRLRPGQLGAVPAVGRRGRGAGAGAVPARRDRRAGPRVRRDAVLRRPDVLRQHAARPSLARRRAAPGSGSPPRPARRCRPRSTQRWTRALRRRHPRRHRHDRDAAHLPVQPAGRGAAGHHRRRGARLRPAHPRRGRARGRRRHAGHAVRARRLDRDRLLVPLRRSRQVFQGEWLRTGDTYVQDADGYYACLGRTGDMLKASGIWVSARPRSRAGCSPTRPWPRPWWSPALDSDGLEKPVAYVVLQPGRVRRPRTS